LDLVGLFENVVILTSKDFPWATQGVVVNKIRKKVLGLTSEIANNSFGSLGIIG
jgi:hypothetical protein